MNDNYPLHGYYDRNLHRPGRDLLDAFQAIANGGKSYRMTIKAEEATILTEALRLYVDPPGLSRKRCMW